MVHASQPAGHGQTVVDFLRWMIHDGQQFVAGMGYAPLPAELVTRIEPQLQRIQVGKQ